MKYQLVQAILLFAVFLAVNARQWCRDLPKNITNDPRTTTERYGANWRLYGYNVIKKTGLHAGIGNPNCWNFQYLGNRNGNASQATVLLMSKKQNKHYVYKSSVNAKMTLWAMEADNGQTASYQTLMLNLAGERSYFSIYKCDREGKYVSDISFLALNDAGKAAMFKDFNKKFSNFPVSPVEQLRTVYNNC